MGRCRNHQCRMTATYNVEGSKAPAYCKQHAEGGMVNVSNKRCVYGSCTRQPNFNVEGSKTSTHCKEHAADGMVNIRNKRCAYGPCTKRPCYNHVGSKTPVYCKQHAGDGMIDVLSKRCSHDSCTRQPSFNFDGSKTAVCCKEHAADGMVNVVSRRCSLESCQKRAAYSVDGSKRPVYCKEHAEDGMVNVLSKRCAHDSCVRHPYFNTEGSKKAMYCLQHAEDGMVDIVSKRCVHDSCHNRPTHDVEGSKNALYCNKHAEDGMVKVISVRCSHYTCARQPTFSFEGSQTPVYCKQHAKKGMVDVVNKYCLQDGCTKHPSLNIVGSKTPAYCKQHAEAGMVNVVSRHCLRGTCTRQPSFNVAGSKEGAYCKEHAKDGMVNVRMRRSSGGARTAEIAQDGPTKLAAAPRTFRKTGILAGTWVKPDTSVEMVTSRKRLRSEPDGEQLPHSLDQRPFKRGWAGNGVRMVSGSEVPGISSSKDIPYVPSAVTLPGFRSFDAIGMAAEQTPAVVPRIMARSTEGVVVEAAVGIGPREETSPSFSSVACPTPLNYDTAGAAANQTPRGMPQTVASSELSGVVNAEGGIVGTAEEMPHRKEVLGGSPSVALPTPLNDDIAGAAAKAAAEVQLQTVPFLEEGGVVETAVGTDPRKEVPRTLSSVAVPRHLNGSAANHPPEAQPQPVALSTQGGLVETALGVGPRSGAPSTLSSITLPRHLNNEADGAANTETHGVQPQTVALSPEGRGVQTLVEVGPRSGAPSTLSSVTLPRHLNYEADGAAVKQPSEAQPQTVALSTRSEVVETAVEVGPRTEVPRTLPSVALPRHLDNDHLTDADAAAVNQTPEVQPQTVAPLPDEHESTGSQKSREHEEYGEHGEHEESEGSDEEEMDVDVGG